MHCNLQNVLVLFHDEIMFFEVLPHKCENRDSYDHEINSWSKIYEENNKWLKNEIKLQIKESEAQKQRPHELLWMLWFDEKSIFSELTKR